MNADLHMATDLKNTGKGNLFVIFGEPDIDVSKLAGDQVRVRVRGVDVFQPSTGEVRSSGPDGIACWFLDTDYNEESFLCGTPTLWARGKGRSVLGKPLSREHFEAVRSPVDTYPP
jgi:hypothetical protein